MTRLHVLLGMFTAAVTLMLVSSGYSQDKKDDTKKDPVVKGKLPAGWSKLGITGDQKKKIVAVISSYQGKIAALKEQIDQLSKEEYREAYKLLTDDQKDMLKKLADKGGDLDKKDDKKGIDPGKVDKKDDKSKVEAPDKKGAP